MIDTLISLTAPHLCYGCSKIGSLLCDNCKYDISDEPFLQCINCLALIKGESCDICQTPYSWSWCVGERTTTLQYLIGGFKFQNVFAAHVPLAELLDRRIGMLPENTVIVPVPTAPAHIRGRGYDHTLLIAKAFAKKRHLKVKKVLRRVGTNKQRGANRTQRERQASTAFISGQLDPSVPYLLIDDVVTTGATIKYAAKALQDGGATSIWVGIIARQVSTNEV
jgi:predicted amidophosphoribosyltransferase